MDQDVAKVDLVAVHAFLAAREIQIYLQQQTDEDNDGKRAALQFAIEAERVDVVRALLNAGTQVNQSDDGNTRYPLHIALETNYIEIVRALLAKGSSISAKDGDGFTALHWAVENLELLQLLLSHAKAVRRAAEGEEIVDIANEQDNEGCTVLHWVAGGVDESFVNALVAA